MSNLLTIEDWEKFINETPPQLRRPTRLEPQFYTKAAQKAWDDAVKEFAKKNGIKYKK